MVVCERLVPVLIVDCEVRDWPSRRETAAARQDNQSPQRSFGAFDGTDGSSGLLSMSETPLTFGYCSG
jgi:hypothetical protein